MRACPVPNCQWADPNAELLECVNCGRKTRGPGPLLATCRDPSAVVREPIILNRDVAKNPCRKRGPEKERISCAGCQGNVEIKIYHCLPRVECAIKTRAKANLQLCITCRDYEPSTP